MFHLPKGPVCGREPQVWSVGLRPYKRPCSVGDLQGAAANNLRLRLLPRHRHIRRVRASKHSARELGCSNESQSFEAVLLPGKGE